MTNLLFSELTYYLRGVCYEIHNELRSGHRESVYENALTIALEQDGVPFQQQPLFRIEYRGKQIGEYRPDLMLADGKLLLELKAQPAIESLHKAQVLSYLRTTNAALGMILNFGAKSMQFERLPNFTEERASAPGRAPKLLEAGFLYPQLTQRLLNALYRVHLTLGSGYLHQVYRRAAQIEFLHTGLQVRYLRELPLRFRGATIGKTTTRQFLIEQKLLVAIVALAKMGTSERERMFWALQATDLRLGLIANFYPSRLGLEFVRRP